MTAQVVSITEAAKRLSDRFERDKSVPYLYRDTRSGIWYVRKFFTSEKIPPIFKSTKQKIKRDARIEADAMIQEWRNKHMGINDAGAYRNRFGSDGKLIGEICDEILRDYTPTQRPQTRKAHGLYLPRIKAHCGNRGINSYSIDDFNAWIDSERRERDRRSFYNYKKHMNIVWRYAYEKKYASHWVKFPDPDKRIRRELEEKPLGQLTKTEKEILELKKSRCMTSAEIEAVWPHLNDTWRLRFLLSLDGIMRFMEAGKLEWDRVSLETGLITLRAQDVKTGSKTGRGRSFYISSRTLEMLHNRKAGRWVRGKGERHHADSPYVFPNFRDPMRPASHNQRIWRDAKRLAGIQGKLRWHDLRHTALTFAILGDPSKPDSERRKMRQDPMLVSEYAGVSMAVIQRVYLHTNAEHTRHVSDAFQRLDLKIQCGISVESEQEAQK